MVELSGRQHGVLGCDQSLRLGATSRDLRRLVRSGNWEMVTARVIGRTGTTASDARRLLVAVLDVGGDASVSHVTGGRWWGLSCPARPLHLTTTHKSSRSTDLAVTHRVRRLPERWRVVKDGVPVVRPELTALQLFAWCGPYRTERAERWVDRLWSLRLLSGPSIGAFLSDMGERGRNGTAGLRRYLDDRGPEYVPPASNLESRLVQLARQEGHELRSQVDTGAENWTGRVDLRHVHLPVVVEVQSEAHHLALVDTAADDRRLARLVADGFHVVEVTDEEVWQHPRVALDRIGEAIAAARAGSVPQIWRARARSGARNGLSQGRVAAWRSSRLGTK